MKIKNPKLSVTVDGLVFLNGYYLDSSNHIHSGRKQESTDFIAVKFNGMLVGVIYDEDNAIASNLVNCTAENGGILITDPTKDASCTICCTIYE